MSDFLDEALTRTCLTSPHNLSKLPPLATPLLDVFRVFPALVGLSFLGATFLGAFDFRVRSLWKFPLAAAYGQFLLFLYAYVRCFLAHALGLPGIGAWELGLLLLGFTAWKTWNRQSIRWRLRSPEAFLVLSALVVLCVQLVVRLGDYATPSSDPDIHAFIAKQILEAGTVSYYYPRSAIAATYPSGFAVLNLVWGRLTGWNGVQLVNVQAYLQGFLMVVPAFLLLFPYLPRRRRGAYSVLALLSFGWVLYPAWLAGRENLEGTARLAANGFFLLPWFSALVFRKHRRPVAGGLSGLVLATLLAFNPSCFIPVFLLTIVAFRVLRLHRSNWLACALATGVGTALVFAVDPFYRWKFASLLAGDSLSALDIKTEVLDGEKSLRFVVPTLSALWNQWVAWVFALTDALTLAIAPRWERAIYFAAAVILFVKSKFARPQRVWFTVILIVYGLVETALHLASVLVPRESLGVHLLFNYTEASTAQMTRAFVCVLLPLLLLKRPHSPLHWLAAATLFFGIGHQVELNARKFARQMVRTTLGAVSSDAVEVVIQGAPLVAVDERVLLQVRLRESLGENWTMPEGASRAVALYSDAATAFYFGLDHPDFKASAYKQFAQKKLDLAWLKRQGIRWAIVEGADPRFDGVGTIEIQKGDVRWIKLYR